MQDADPGVAGPGVLLPPRSAPPGVMDAPYRATCELAAQGPPSFMYTSVTRPLIRRLLPDRCHQRLLLDRCHQTAVIRRLLPDRCHQRLLLDRCHQTAVTRRLLPDRCHQRLLLDRCHQTAVTRPCHQTAVTRRCHQTAVTRRCHQTAVTRRCHQTAVTRCSPHYHSVWTALFQCVCVLMGKSSVPMELL